MPVVSLIRGNVIVRPPGTIGASISLGDCQGWCGSDGERRWW